MAMESLKKEILPGKINLIRQFIIAAMKTTQKSSQDHFFSQQLLGND
jgi:hypothetical protein